MLEWLFKTIYGAVADFFGMINSMAAEIFELNWVNAFLSLFSSFGWALFAAGLAVAVFDTAIEYQSGRVNIQSTCLNILKGFMAVSLFTRLPVALYKFCITLQTTFSDDLMSSFTGSVRGNLGDTASVVLKSMAGYSGLIGILTVIALAYCVIKLFFANIKRGGILLFLGLLTWQTNMLLGLGIMLSASEVPRIAQQFGLDTSVRFNMVSVSSTVNTAMRAGKFVTGKLA